MKLLFVDDDHDTTWTFTDLAKLMGHEAISASNGSEALAQARRIVPDFIFLDVLLGADDGRDICAQLRGDRALSGCRIVAVTGIQHAHAKCDPTLFDAVLAKPVTLNLLENLLNSNAGLAGRLAARDCRGAVETKPPHD